jgi:hypothetical protein
MAQTKMDRFTALKTLGLPVADTTLAREAWLHDDRLLPRVEDIDNPVDDCPAAFFAQTFQRRGVTALTVLVTQSLYVSPIWLTAGDVVTNISLANGAATVTPAHMLAGLFDKDRVKLASSTDDTTTVWAINTILTVPLSAPFTITYTGWHYCGFAVDASTLPTVANRVTGAVPILAAAAPAITGGLCQASITTALPSTFTTPPAGGVTPWFAVS